MRILDLFCGEGGAAVGYDWTGFTVYGVDLGTPRKDGTYRLGPLRRFPFAHHRGDAIAVLNALLAGERVAFTRPDGVIELPGLEHFDAIHASPPCQGYTIATAGNPEARAKYQRLIPAVRELLIRTGKPYVIENVTGARQELVEPFMLCGTMFGLSAIDDDGTKLEMWRHRYFETNFGVGLVPECDHGWYSEQVAGSYGGARRDKEEARHVRKGGYVPSKEVQAELLGIDWMTQKGMFESIPPVYAAWVGEALAMEVDHRREQAA